jgi:hypothetical protein
MSQQTASIRAALLSAGTTLQLERVALDATIAPVALGSGYDVAGAIQARLLIGMRRGSPGRVVDVKVTTFDASATYTAIIGGTSVAYSGAPADIPALCAAWAALITADGTVGAAGSAFKTTAEAVASVSGGAIDTVRIKGSDAASWTFSATDSGTAALSVTLDPETCTLTMYEACVDQSGLASTTYLTDYQRAQVTGWGIMQGLAGDATVTITDGQTRPVPLVVAGVSRVRPYITAYGGVTGDAATAGSVTVTIAKPTAVVLFGRVPA